ncbi:hypothetical protein [Nostoc flagelliforme]|uniref:hypothetical protein n=1 Tax=Nostoc flagelliforme TaxID=1306274 RepID=UPI0026CEE180
MVVVMADAGYQFVISVIFVMVERDFDYSQLLQGNCLGCDEPVEFGLSFALFVWGNSSEFLNLAGLIFSDRANPRIRNN